MVLDMMIREGYSATNVFFVFRDGYMWFSTCSGFSMVHTGWWFGYFHNDYYDYIVIVV